MNYSTVSVRLTTEDKEILNKCAEQLDMSMSAVIRVAVKEYIERHQ